MIKKQVLAAAAMASLIPLTLSACGGGGSNAGGSASSSSEAIDSLTVLDYYTDEPGKSAVMATAMLASIPAIILLVIAQKYIAAGATGGAVK